jgi:hypothetical protein
MERAWLLRGTVARLGSIPLLRPERVLPRRAGSLAGQRGEAGVSRVRAAACPVRGVRSVYSQAWLAGS